jgi:hypothetical protein
MCSSKDSFKSPGFIKYKLFIKHAEEMSVPRVRVTCQRWPINWGRFAQS